MCKIIAFTNLSKLKNSNRLTQVACDLVGSSDRDGFGYAVQGSKGLYGEKSTRPVSFTPSFSRPALDVPFADPGYARFGDKAKPVGGGIFHGRTSTNQPGIVNTHPIQRDDWALIHNGVVSNHGPKYETITSNDTEHLVYHLARGGISAVAANLTGYYAFAAFDPDERLHVARDSTAYLYVARITSIDSLVFATKEDHIRELCEEMDWKHSVPGLVHDNTYLVFENGAVTHHSTFTPRGRTEYESKYASLSLGRSLESDWSAPSSYATDEDWTASPKFAAETPPAAAYSPDTDSDEELFLAEMDLHADSSYLIRDYSGREISLAEFRALDTDDKLCCLVVRSDGTVCDPADYYTERLYGT